MARKIRVEFEGAVYYVINCGKRYWERQLEQGLAAVGRTREDELTSSAKGTEWKVALARYLRETSLVPHAWLAEHLQMGTANSAAVRISSHRRRKGKEIKICGKL